MRATVWRGFHAVTASTAFTLALLSMRTVLTTPGITTEHGFFLLLLAFGGVTAALWHGWLTLDDDDWPLSIRARRQTPIASRATAMSPDRWESVHAA